MLITCKKTIYKLKRAFDKIQLILQVNMNRIKVFKTTFSTVDKRLIGTKDSYYMVELQFRDLLFESLHLGSYMHLLLAKMVPPSTSVQFSVKWMRAYT